jgi:hypothetical protein
LFFCLAFFSLFFSLHLFSLLSFFFLFFASFPLSWFFALTPKGMRRGRKKKCRLPEIGGKEKKERGNLHQLRTNAGQIERL